MLCSSSTGSSAARGHLLTVLRWDGERTGEGIGQELVGWDKGSLIVEAKATRASRAKQGMRGVLPSSRKMLSHFQGSWAHHMSVSWEGKCQHSQRPNECYEGHTGRQLHTDTPWKRCSALCICWRCLADISRSLAGGRPTGLAGGGVWALIRSADQMEMALLPPLRIRLCFHSLEIIKPEGILTFLQLL